MTGRRDESVSFSLRELQELEEQRIAREKREIVEREAALVRENEERARREAAARAEAEEREAKARDEARRREMEEVARREAMQKAIVEQARIQVEAKTRSDEADRERRHELELARVRAENEKKQPGTIVVSGIAGAFLASLFAVTLHLAVLKPATEARVAAITDMAGRAGAHAADLERRVDEQNKQISGLRDDLTSARQEIQKLKDQKPASPTTAPNGTRTRTTTTRTNTNTQTREKCADPKDPMCFDIP